MKMTLKRRTRAQQGFTLLELIIVVTMIGILAAIALPNLIQMPRRAKEATLKTNLRTIRQAIDQFYGDLGYYPDSLEALAEEEYLRDVPIDPMTESTEWEVIYEVEDEFESEDPGAGEDTGPGIIDVHSLSDDVALDGTPYAEW